MTFSYSGNPQNSPTDAVRFEIQDTINTNFLLADEEIAYAILQESGVEPDGGYTAAEILSAAAHCFEALARRFTLQADTVIGQLKVTYKDAAKNMQASAVALRLRAQGMQGPYVGGLSRSDEFANRSDPDRDQPAFTRREFNNPWTGQGNGLFSTTDLGPTLND